MADGNKDGIPEWMRNIPRSSENEREIAAAVYDKYASLYDKDIPLENKPDPGIIAKELAAILNNVKNIRILDVCSGTGYVGYELSKLGFTNIDALDGSAPMLEIAKSKNHYKNCYCTCFTKDPTPGLADESYNALVSTGSFCPGHLHVDCFVECLRVITSGGYIVLGTYNWPELFGEDDNNEQRLQQAIQTYADSTLCEIVKIQRYEQYNFAGKSGVVFIVKKL